MSVGYLCYEGREVVGVSDVMMSRGRVIVENVEWKGERGWGRFLRRKTARE